LCTVANNLATLSLIFSRRVDDAGSEDLLILSANTRNKLAENLEKKEDQIL
jgi:hypothetical protein